MARPTFENKEAIQRAKENLLSAAGLLNDILEGKAYQTEVAEKLGVQSMQHMISEGFEPYIRSVITSIDNIGQTLNKHMTPEQRILMNTLMPNDPNVFGKDHKLRILPKYDADAVQDAIDEYLTEKEAKILRMSCGCDPDMPGNAFTLDEMGKATDISKERARQLRDRAFEKLRRPEVQRKIFAPAFESLEAETDYIKSALHELQTEYQRAKDEYDELCVKLKAVNHAKTTGEQLDANLMPRHDMPLESAEDARIPDPELSYRSNHWLKEAGYLTLMDVYRAGTDKLMTIRGLGAKSVAELTCLFRDRYHVTLPKAES